MTGLARSPLLAVLLRPERLPALTPAEQGLLLQRARRSLLAGRLAFALRRSNLWDELCPELQAALAGAMRAQRYREGLIRRELDILAREFAPAFGRPVVALKGAAYLLRGLDAALGRVAADVDLLVAEEAVDEARALLEDLGYRTAEEKDNPYDRRYYRSFMHEVAPLRHEGRGIELDLHFRLLPRTHRLAFAMDPVWAEIRRVADSAYHTLGDADLFLHAAAHFLVDGEGREATRRILELYDLSTLWPSRGEMRAEVAARARRLGLAPVAKAAFALLRQLEGLTDGPGRGRHAAARGAMPVARWALWRVQEEEEGGRPAAFARWLLWLRGHLLRMPLGLLVPHLARKLLLRLRNREGERP